MSLIGVGVHSVVDFGLHITANALVFGDLNDPDSAVSRLASSPRGTKLLEDMGAKPNITYLQREIWHESNVKS